ncbi:MAG TPA: MauE/DoxX family redox-associated membrane protein [Ohtaekwangia sp.]|nr:MauE/DoxX family redox-associated membrane protein [Ohtaekwangia sp.]
MLTQDQMRWQPWIYLYSLLLVPYLLKVHQGIRERSLIVCLQLIVAGVYVWSGIHKLNVGFLDVTFAQMTRVLGVADPLRDWKEIGYAIPLIEMATGIGLLIPKFRASAVFAAVITHVLILLYLSPAGLDHNTAVYPWNAAMISFVILLFWGVKDSVKLPAREIRYDYPLMMPVVLVWIFPMLNCFGHWDHYPSFSLYSNRPSSFYIAIENGEINKIDKRFQRYFASIPGLQGGALIAMDKWSFAELNVPFYPETRAFKKISTEFCDLGIAPEKLVFLELYRSEGKVNFDRFTCAEPCCAGQH